MELDALIDPALAPFADEAWAAQQAAAAAAAGRRVDLSTPEGVEQARQPNPAFADAAPIAVEAEQFDVGRTGVEARLLRSPEAVRPRGVYLYVHGGGFYTGRPAMADRANAALTTELGVCTMSVRYRLAPEHPHPAAEDDVTAVAEWLIEHAEEEFGTTALVIGGSSAGATLAVRALVRLGADRDRFAGTNLIYGVFDLAGTPSQRTADLRFFNAYLPGLHGEARRVAEISPLYADLTGMPDALFTVGSDDFVLDDSLFMALRWRAAGNRADLDVYPGCGHGFDGFPTTMASIAESRITAWIGRRLGG